MTDSIALMLLTEVAWAVTSIIFRSILVKYADRGLVSGGVVSKLFDYLYALLGATLTALLSARLLLVNEALEGERLINICFNTSQLNENPWKQETKRLFVTSLTVIALWILYWSCQKFVKARSRDGKTPPAIFGRYKRNVVTFLETLWFHTIMYLSSTVIVPAINIWTDSLYACIVLIGIPFLFNCNILVKLMNHTNTNTNQAAAEDQKKTFYVREPQIQPRRDHFIANTNVPAQKIQHSILIPSPSLIFVKPLINDLD